MKQKLMTAELRRKLPELYTNENLPDAGDAIVVAHFFNAYGAGDWYITEFDGDDTMFGFVSLGMDDEWGYASLSELTELRAVIGGRTMPFQAIERDAHWIAKPFRDVERLLAGRARGGGQ